MAAFSEAGYELAVQGSAVRFPQVIEVYPHIAVMRLVDAAYRVPYKLGRIRQYWPHATPAARRENLRANLAKILRALRDRIAGIPLELPTAETGPAQMKRFEDALDAIVCAWIGTRYVEGQCLAYGDETAAIWVPI
jgi:predicted RNase H-like nuclease